MNHPRPYVDRWTAWSMYGNAGNPDDAPLCVRPDGTLEWSRGFAVRTIARFASQAEALEAARIAGAPHREGAMTDATLYPFFADELIGIYPAPATNIHQAPKPRSHPDEIRDMLEADRRARIA